MKPLNLNSKIKTTEEKLVIVALGDSLTYGWMVTKGYLYYLQEMISKKYPHRKIKFINSGTPGDTAKGGLYRIDNDVLKHNPNLVFIQFGLNDTYAGFTPEKFKQYLSSIIKEIKAKPNIKIVLLTSIPVNNTIEEVIIESMYKKIIECGKEYNIPVIKVHEYWKRKIKEGENFDSLIQSDGIHPTEKGYSLMAEAIMEIF